MKVDLKSEGSGDFERDTNDDELENLYKESIKSRQTNIKTEPTAENESLSKINTKAHKFKMI
jgi:hypothetical protein